MPSRLPRWRPLPSAHHCCLVHKLGPVAAAEATNSNTFVQQNTLVYKACAASCSSPSCIFWFTNLLHDHWAGHQLALPTCSATTCTCHNTAHDLHNDDRRSITSCAHLRNNTQRNSTEPDSTLFNRIILFNKLSVYQRKMLVFNTGLCVC